MGTKHKDMDGEFAKLANKVALEEAIDHLWKRLPGITEENTDLIAQAVAGGIAIGAYTGVMLEKFGIPAPNEELEEFSRVFSEVVVKIQNLSTVMRHEVMNRVRKAEEEAKEPPS